MTTIAAIQGDGWVVMGADTQSTYHGYRAVTMADDKVVDNNGVLIAGCGSGRGSNIIHHKWKAPKPTTKKTPEQLDKWMAKVFIPQLREVFIEAGYDMKDDGDYAQHESVFLIAVQGVLYIIDDDYSFDRDSRNYITSGSGGDFAQGALYYAGDRIFTDKEYAVKAMSKAVNGAKEFDVFSGGETRIYTQEA